MIIKKLILEAPIYQKKFPTPEMLERIAVALGIDPPALFSTAFYPSQAAGTLARFQEQILHDVFEVISHRVKELERETPQAICPPGDSGGTAV